MHNTDVIDTDLDLADLNGPAPKVSIFPKKLGVRKRKPKTSTIPEDYDPFATIDGVKDGYQRPPQKCWVSRAIARPVSLSELSPLWRMDTSKVGTKDRKHRFLASIVAMVDGDYHVRRKHNGMWTAKKKAVEVKAILWNEWGGSETAFGIRKGTIDDFFTERSYVVLDQVAYIPGAGSFVEYKGKACLNRYYEHPLAYPLDAVISDETTLLIEMIVKNLLGHQDGDLSAWCDAIFDAEPSAIKWLFHWLACLYQRPGHAHSTVLWFVGPAQGVGKGLFTSGLATLLGTSNVKQASAEEFKGEWSDFLMNASLFIMDEVDFSSRKEANSKLKRLVSNKTLALRKRNHGEIEIPAVASFVFTTNNVRPLALDRDDRRNTFFETNGSAEAKERAAKFYRLGETRQRNAWEGLAELLSMIEIDEQLISKAITTDVKERMISSGVDPFDEWFQTDEVLQSWPVGEFAPVAWIKRNYTYWARDNAYRGCATSAYCQDKLNELVSDASLSQKLRKTLHDGTKLHGYVRRGPETELDEPSLKNCRPISLYRKGPNADKVRDKILHGRGPRRSAN